MADPSPSRRDLLTIPAINPVDGRRREVMISHDRLQAIARRGMNHVQECAKLVPYALQHPSAIFEGIRHEQDEDRDGGGWLCYCCVPLESFRRDGSSAPAYPDQVFLVFVNDQGVAYNWRWEKADPDNPALPVGHVNRFRRKAL